MKKLALLIMMLVFGFTNAQAPLEEGGLQVNGGFGSSSWGTPIYAGLDYGIAPNFTVGGELSFQSYKSANILGLQANGNYHFNEAFEIPSEWDFYAGANLNFYNWSKDVSDADDADSFGLGLQVGGRYFFTDQFAVNLQIGGGNVNSGGKIGITYKL
jgi:outer membrane immunogenic protein